MTCYVVYCTYSIFLYRKIFFSKEVFKRITTTKFDYFEKIHIYISKEIISLLPRYVIRLKIKNIVKEKNTTLPTWKIDNNMINHFQRYLKEYRRSVMT